MNRSRRPALAGCVRTILLTYTDPQGTDPPTDPKPLTLGPLAVSNLCGSASVNGSLSATINGIRSSDRSIEVDC
ncbi:MAG: hypothetical protein ABIQ53_12705 [Terracoccus sp.]